MKLFAKIVSCAITTVFMVFLTVPASTAETAAERDQRLAWWREARLGMFIHWGPVSIKGTEIGWSRGGERPGIGGKGEIPLEVYDNLYKEFNPTNFNAREWVGIAKDMGAKYLVFTSKHHDGFAMFDSQLTDYKITRSPFRRDVAKELADACHEMGIKLGFYYSPPDWHHPDYRRAGHARYVEYLHGQVRELCTRYGRLDVIWFDGLNCTAKELESEKMVAMIRQLQPQIVINNRAGLPEDHDTPEQEIGHFQIDRPWESCITLCNQWAWKPGDDMKSLKQCLNTLIRCAGGDGNLLFNVGPMPTGDIEPRQVERLKEMGQWLRQYGFTVYGTRGGPYKPGAWGVSTRKGNSVYLHVLEWPGGQLTLPDPGKKIIRSRFVHGQNADVKQGPDGITITVEPGQRHPIDTIIELIVEGPAGEIPPLATQRSGSLAANRPATASNVFGRMPVHGPDKAVDDDPGTRWATDGGTSQAWLEIDLGKPAVFSRVEIDEWAGADKRIQEFDLQSQSGGQWSSFHHGQTIGAGWKLKLEKPVTAQKIRLNILKATEGPTIDEFRVFP